jgi:hypothetical protein
MSDYLNLHVTGTQDTRYQVKIKIKGLFRDYRMYDK